MSHPSEIPTEKDWDWDPPCDYYDGAVKYARNYFSGKSIHEMISYITEQPLSASEELSNMPKIPFQYYVMAYRAVFMSEVQRRELLQQFNASDAASSFLRLLIFQFERLPEFIAPIMQALLPVAEYVAANQGLFEADLEIYGSFPELLNDIKARYFAYQSFSD